MMAHRHFLHELLEKDQEPFHLNSYIAEKRSQLNNSSPATALQVEKRNPIGGETSTKRSNLSGNACFFDFQSPGISSCKSSGGGGGGGGGGGAVLHVPSETAALLVEAAMRIQKQQQSKPKTKIKSAGFSLFGSFLKILKDRSKNKKREIVDNELKFLRDHGQKEKGKLQENVRISSSCSSESPPSSSRRTPESRSPAASLIRLVKQEKEKYAIGGNFGNVCGVEEEEEKCSPVSVLDPLFEDEGHESEDAEEDDHDLDSTFANIERARQQLLNRLRRFERLAALDPIELEQKLLDGSDDEYQRESVESKDDDLLSLPRKQDVETSSLQHNPRKMSTGMRKLVSDQTVEDKRKIILSGNKVVVFGRICNRLHLRKEFESGVVDMMVELDFKRECEERKKFAEQVMEETTAEIERAIFGGLVEELSDELFYMNDWHQELNSVVTEWI